jgi:hypothetical protein
MPVILAAQDAESKRIVVHSQHWANSLGGPTLKNLITTKGLVEWLKP